MGHLISDSLHLARYLEFISATNPFNVKSKVVQHFHDAIPVVSLDQYYLVFKRTAHPQFGF